MNRRKSPLLTDRESEIMSVLWELGSATSEEIRSRVPGNPHDSTTRTLLRVLVNKGHVVANRDSRPTQYRAAVERQCVQKSAMRDLLKRFFGGSAEELVLHLLDDDRLSPEQLKKLEMDYQKHSIQEDTR